MFAQRLIKAAVALAAAAFFVPAAAAQDQVLDPVTILPGLWGWDTEVREGADYGTCENAPLRIWFSDRGERYNAQNVGSEAVFTAPVLAHLPATAELAGILIRYDDEDRLDDAGNVVAWWLVMTGENSFIWIRNDWVGTGGSTAPLVRCDDSLIG
ncbi:hypothetical protein [Maricaulis sp.]|uniref:hypothetical protein n=1 Tax=Maricaulis sp. TaxID=1486257 RepID=UPI002B277412|nr:hypothetical protein [Maricaulis sp.]